MNWVIKWRGSSCESSPTHTLSRYASREIAHEWAKCCFQGLNETTQLFFSTFDDLSLKVWHERRQVIWIPAKNLKKTDFLFWDCILIDLWIFLLIALDGLGQEEEVWVISPFSYQEEHEITRGQQSSQPLIVYHLQTDLKQTPPRWRRPVNIRRSCVIQHLSERWKHHHHEADSTLCCVIYKPPGRCFYCRFFLSEQDLKTFF